MAKDKMLDPDSGGKPERVKDDPYADLFADCNTVEEVLALQREIEAAEREEQ